MLFIAFLPALVALLATTLNTVWPYLLAGAILLTIARLVIHVRDNRW